MGSTCTTLIKSSSRDWDSYFTTAWSVFKRTRQLECHMRLTMNSTNRWINYGRHSCTEPCMTKQTDETVTNFCHCSMNIPPREYMCDNKNLLCLTSFSFSRQHTITKHVNKTWSIFFRIPINFNGSCSTDAGGSNNRHFWTNNLVNLSRKCHASNQAAKPWNHDTSRMCTKPSVATILSCDVWS